MLTRKLKIVQAQAPRQVTSFSLPIDLLAELRDMAVETKLPMSRIIEESIRGQLTIWSKYRARIKNHDKRFPGRPIT